MLRPIWTKNQPAEPGWYWKQKAKKSLREYDDEKEIVHVRNYCGELCIGNWCISLKDAEWAGPILEPKNQKLKEE